MDINLIISFPRGKARKTTSADTIDGYNSGRTKLSKTFHISYDKDIWFPYPVSIYLGESTDSENTTLGMLSCFNTIEPRSSEPSFQPQGPISLSYFLNTLQSIFIYWATSSAFVLIF